MLISKSKKKKKNEDISKKKKKNEVISKKTAKTQEKLL